MSFESFKSIADVLVQYQITSTDQTFIQPLEIAINPVFCDRLNRYLEEFVLDSKNAICEMIVFPILAEVYLKHRQHFVLWSHMPLVYDDLLTGTSDYTLAHRSHLGKVIWEKPYFVAVVTEKGDFIKGWGECLAQMVAMQKLNNNSDQSAYGIVSNGQSWEFGILTQNTFIQDPKSYQLSNLDELMAALHFLFQCCEELI
jgi:hypothetical protein